MPLRIVGDLTKTHVRYDEPTLPASIRVPSRREALEALQHFQHLVAAPAATAPSALAGALTTIHRFIMTR